VPPDIIAAFADQAGRTSLPSLQGARARQAQRAGGNPRRPHRGRALQPLCNDQAARISRLLSAAAASSDRRRLRRHLGGALVFGLGFPWLEQGIDAISRAVVGAGPFGLFVYGVLNRLLIVTGLHHILNNIAWFILGDFEGATGDLNRFFAGDPMPAASCRASSR
jgi:hypothetical protein